MLPSEAPAVAPSAHPPWLRLIWLVLGIVALVLGIVGIFLPLLPTTPFVLLAAYCFSRGSARWERWLLQHPRLGPMVRDWRATLVAAAALPLSVIPAFLGQYWF
eukprot:gene50574-67719_t